MFTVCPNCGEHRADKTIDPAGPYAICPVCGHAQPFRRMPLFLVGGPSAAGKSTVLLALTGRVEQVVLLDGDILWRPEFNQPETRYRAYFELWLCMAKNVGQSGRPVALFGGGFAVPENIEPCIERRYFSTVYYLALTCREEVLVARLQARPGWRRSAGDEFVRKQVEFNAWLLSNTEQMGRPITTLDTTDGRPEETARQVTEWISARLPARDNE